MGEIAEVTGKVGVGGFGVELGSVTTKSMGLGMVLGEIATEDAIVDKDTSEGAIVDKDTTKEALVNKDTLQGAIV